MRRIRSIGPIAMGVFALLVAGSLIAQGQDDDAREGQETVFGRVMVAEENDDGEVLAVSIDDADWGPVLVASNGRGRELVELVGAFVEATGRIDELDEEEFSYIIHVEAYSVIEG